VSLLLLLQRLTLLKAAIALLIHSKIFFPFSIYIASAMTKERYKSKMAEGTTIKSIIYYENIFIKFN